MIPSDANDQAGESAERLAPVTYLFGAKSTGGAARGSAGHALAAISPSHPVFRDESPVTSVHDREKTVEKTVERRPERGSFDRVSKVSMYALARHGMSSKEMRDYLVAREFEDTVVDQEIGRLEGVGLLDDDSLAETVVRTLRDRKGLGRAALTAELRRRHVGGDAIEEAMGGLDDDELERATSIALKRAPQLRSLDPVTAKRRLGAFLMRKGYSGSVISTAVQRALAPAGPSFR